jgi:hypothetical protein
VPELWLDGIPYYCDSNAPFGSSISVSLNKQERNEVALSWEGSTMPEQRETENHAVLTRTKRYESPSAQTQVQPSHTSTDLYVRYDFHGGEQLGLELKLEIHMTNHFWKQNAGGKNEMHLVASTISSHESICSMLGIFARYVEALGVKKNIGSSTETESQHHLLGRYLNSASRTQYIACTDEADAIQIKEELLAQLLGGKLYVVDIAAGNGAGTMSLINSICELRVVSQELPRDALDIEIHALDFSQHSLSYYERIAEMLREKHLEAGITVSVKPHLLDLTKDASLKATISEVKQKIGENPRYLLICSAISGVGQETFKTHFRHSYKYIVESFQQINSTFFWVEPHTEKKWMLVWWSEFLALFRSNPLPKDNVGLRTQYCWVDPHTKTSLDTGADFFLMGLAP